MSRRGALALVSALVLFAAILVAVVVGGLLPGGSATPTAALGAPPFVEETATPGIAHTYDGGYEF